MQVLSDLPPQTAEQLLVAGGPDDAGVYVLDEDRVMIQSVDFFTPIVDDASDYGRIAATNSLSDVYAMGGRPITALNIVGVPLEEVGIERLKAILAAGQETMREAGGVVVGGHTVKTPEPLYGMAVTGLAPRDRFLRNAQVSPGDRLILTKPLGTGIVTTALSRGHPVEAPLREATRWMSRLNDVALQLTEEGLLSGMTDITGYGFLGHLYELLGEKTGAIIHFSRLPKLPGLDDLIAEGFVPGGTRDNWNAVRDRVRADSLPEDNRWILADAQTSGGLLLAVPEPRCDRVQAILRDEKLPRDIVGRVSEGRIVVVEP